MGLEFDRISDAAGPAAGEQAEPSRTLSELPATPSRRTVLGAMTVAAVGLGAAALSFAWPGQARRAYAETGRGGIQGFDDAHCKDAYPNGYGEVRDSGGPYTSGNGYYPACVGGSYISHSYCLFGWHRYPRSDRCGPTGNRKNSWRWTTADGKVFRCSDGNTVINGWSYFTVCRSRVA